MRINYSKISTRLFWIGFFFAAGTAGASDTNTIDFPHFLLQAAIAIICLYFSNYFEVKGEEE